MLDRIYENRNDVAAQKILWLKVQGLFSAKRGFHKEVADTEAAEC